MIASGKGEVWVTAGSRWKQARNSTLPSAPVMGDWIHPWQQKPKPSTPLITRSKTCSKIALKNVNSHHFHQQFVTCDFLQLAAGEETSWIIQDIQMEKENKRLNISNSAPIDGWGQPMLLNLLSPDSLNFYDIKVICKDSGSNSATWWVWEHESDP